MNELLLGVGRRIITPEVGCALRGYRPDIFSESVNDELTATAFVFRQGEVTALMVSVTLCSVRSDILDRIFKEIEERFGIPRSNAMIHSIHTHSGPCANGPDPDANGNGGGWGAINMEYCESVLIPGVVEAVREAAENCVPVKMKISVGESRVAVNRRELTADNRIALGQNPWGPMDPKMTVVSFEGEEGKTVANIIHYAAHGTASGGNHEITRDWAGVMIDILERISGGVTAFFNGPEGDIGPRITNGKTTGDLRYALELGAVAGHDAVRIYKQRGGLCTPALSVSEKEIAIPLAPRIPKEEAEAGYGQFKDKKVNIGARKGAYYKNVLNSYNTNYKEKESVSFPQTVIRLGDIAFVSFPFELFSEIGLRIAKESAIPHTLSLSITNGSRGYFVTEEATLRGGYEVEMFKTANVQPYVHDADFKLMQATLEHLKEL